MKIICNYFTFDYFIQLLYLKTTVRYLKNLKSTVYFVCICILYKYYIILFVFVYYTSVLYLFVLLFIVRFCFWFFDSSSFSLNIAHTEPDETMTLKPWEIWTVTPLIYTHTQRQKRKRSFGDSVQHDWSINQFIDTSKKDMGTCKNLSSNVEMYTSQRLSRHEPCSNASRDCTITFAGCIFFMSVSLLWPSQ